MQTMKVAGAWISAGLISLGMCVSLTCEAHGNMKDKKAIGEFRKGPDSTKISPRKPGKKKIFENLSPTPQLAKGVTMLTILKAQFSKPESVKPAVILPSVKTDLKSLHSSKPSLVWFGHSSYLIRHTGVNILVDPVLSGNAGPAGLLKPFKGSNAYKAADMPETDLVIITHNHYDHLDLKTLKQLASKTKAFVVPLEVGRHLRKLDIPEDRITELDWWGSMQLREDIRITATPARHFSGRGFRKNRTLWASFVLEMKDCRIFIGGDSGYDMHFKEIGDKYGPFDIAVLECGQYNSMWPYIHSTPEEVVREGKDLNAKVIMPVHWGKFALALHDWDEPVRRFVTEAEKQGAAYTTPMIGEPVILNERYPTSQWWLKGSNAFESRNQCVTQHIPLSCLV
jgi:L-ascorbate metabolism protein UlaG (beta-lactamase superfamily)